MGGLADAVSDFVEGVGDLIEGVGKAAVKVVNFAVDKIIEPVVKTVGNVIEAALNDPLKTIAQVAAIATGNAWALPLIEGADVAIAGGDLSDVLEATAKAYVMQEVGSYVGKAAGSYAGQAATEAGASAAAAKVAENVIGAASGSAAVAVVTGRDPVQAFISGGVGAAVPAALGKITGFQQLPGAAQRVISAAVSAQLTGQNVTAATINSAIAASGIVTSIIRSYDPDGTKLDAAQEAIITDVLMGTATAAITGGNPSNIVQAAMIKAGSAALGQMVTDAFKTSTKEASTVYNQANTKATELETNEAAQKSAAANYNKYADEMRTRVDKQTELLMARTKAVEAYNASNTQENYDAAQAATKAYNDHVTALNKDYAEYFKPNLDKYGGELDKLKQTHATLTGDYEKLIQAFSTKTDTLTDKLDPIYFNSNRAFVEAMSPGFNPEEYRKLNGLGAGDDVYDHYLAKGQFQGVPTNMKDAQTEIIGQRTRLVNEALAAKGVTLATADPDQVKKILDNIDSSYGNNVVALRGASVQDILRGNTATLDKLVSDQKDGYVMRIEVTGQAYGGWKAPPAADSFTPPPGTRYATEQEFNNDTAKLMYTKNGNAVWVTEDPSSAVQVWDAATGSYITQLPPVIITAQRPTTLDKILAYGSDPSTWHGAVGDAIINASRTLVDWAKSTGNSTIINTAANVIKAGGGFLESINGISVLAGYAPKNTALGKFADALQSIGKAGNTTEYQAAIKNMQTMIGDAKGVGGTLKAIYGAFKSAPLEFLAEYVGVEGIQEVAPLLIGGVASAGAKGATLALKYGQAVAQRMGTAAGMTASILTDVVESAGGAASGAYDEAYRAAIKAGKSATEADKIALDIAQRSALVAAGTTAVSMGVGGAALEKALLGKTGTGMGDALQALGDFAKTGSKIAIKEGVSEAGEEGVNAAYLETQLYKLDPTRDAAANITAAAAFGAIAGGPIAGGAYGASRTGDVISNALLANPAVADTVNNAASPEAASAALRNMGVTDTATQANLLNTKYDAQYTSSDEAAAALAKRGDYVYTDADVKALTGNTSNINLTNAVEQYVDPRVFDIAEVKAAAAAEGYTISDEDAAKLAGQKDEASATSTARAQFDPLATTYDEAKSFFTARGYTPSADEIRSFVGNKTEADQTKAVADYVNPRQVTTEEARKYLTDLGYKPTDAEVNRFVGQVNEAEQAKAIGAYVDPRMVDEGEVKAAYELLGLKKPTTSDIQKFVGQYSESELAGKTEAYIPTARYNSIIEQLDALSNGGAASQDVLNAIDTVKRDFNAQLADLGVDISKISSDVAATKDELKTAISDAQKGNTTRFGDIDKAIADLKAAGLTEDQVQKIVDDSAAGVSKDFKAALDAAVKGNSDALTKVQEDLTTKIGDVQTALEEKLGDQKTAFDAKVKDLMDQGKTYQEATETALKDIGVQITDLGTDFATKLKDTSDALGKQIGDLSTKLSDVERSLLEKIADNEKAGLSRDEATQKAITDLTKDFGIAKEDLLKQLGATETTLNERVNTLQKAFTEQVGTLETNILAKMAEYEKAGISRDEALSKAVDAVAKDLGTTKEDLLKQIGTTEESLSKRVTDVETSLGTKITESQDAILKELGLTKTGLSEEIAGVKESLSTQIGDVETNILNRMADYEKAGISRDEALGRAIDDVATQLGTTRDDILTRIGETEAALKGDISTAKQEVLDRAAEYEQAGIARDEALQRALSDTEQRLGTKIGDLQTTIGTDTQIATQQDLDTVIQLLEQQGAYDPQYDYNGDRVIDQKDKIAIETVLRSQQPDYKPDPNQPFKFAPAAGTKWAPTGMFGTIAANQAATEKAIADESARTRAAQEQAALKTQRLGNLNTMMQMLGQAGDVGGQQVTVKAADPAKIGYIYDWSSIFANPSQEKLFASPYAQGGVVRDEMDDVNDELLKILRG